MFRRFLHTAKTANPQAGTKTYLPPDPITGIRAPRTEFTGVVIGTKAQKTVKVRVERHKLHPIVMKNVISHRNFLVHDPKEECVVGDLVRCVSCLKVSKKKNFIVGEIVKPAERCLDSLGKMHTQAAERKVDSSIQAQMDLYGKIAIEELKELGKK